MFDTSVANLLQNEPVGIAPNDADTLAYRSDNGTLPKTTKVSTIARYKTTSSANAVVAPVKSVKVLQNWEGTVTSVDDDAFQAQMRNTRDGSSRASEVFDIDIDNVTDGDIGLLREGAKFYLTVVSVVMPGEGPQKTTRLVFRRLPRMSASVIKEAEEEANMIWESLQPGLKEQFQPSEKPENAD